MALPAVRTVHDPLAFGVDHLHLARATYRTDLQKLDHLPPDRLAHLARAETEHRHHQTNLAYAEGRDPTGSGPAGPDRTKALLGRHDKASPRELRG